MVNQVRNPSYRAGEKLEHSARVSGINMLRPLITALEKGLMVRLTLTNMEGVETEFVLSEVHVDGA